MIHDEKLYGTSMTTAILLLKYCTYGPMKKTTVIDILVVQLFLGYPFSLTIRLCARHSFREVIFTSHFNLFGISKQSLPSHPHLHPSYTRFLFHFRHCALNDHYLIRM